MMIGRVVALHILLPVPFRLLDQIGVSIEFVVDTGFTGDLTIPLVVVEKLKLEYIESISANLATDDEVELPVYAATIMWEGVDREVRVLATGKRPLLGTALLKGYELLAQFTDNGLATIDAI